MNGDRTARARPRFWPRRTRLVAALAVGVLVAAGPVSTRPASAADPCSPVVNPIVCENSRPGAADEEWDILGAGDDSIQGFATDISVNAGQRVNFKIKTAASAYTIRIYRLGYYGGAGARFITAVTPSVPLPQNQPPNCVSETAVELYDCGNWAVSAFWNVPATAVSGVYVARLQRGTGGASHITFVVRNDASTADLIFQTSDTTWHAYNTYGGADFYSGAVNGRAYKISYNRPFNTRGLMGGRDFLFSNEYPMLRFLERNGYDVSYTTGVDSDRRGALIRNHKVFVSVGHDEYWSGNQRANVEAARDAGVSLAFFSGNEVYWRTRWESSRDGSNTAYRTLVCYKETWADNRIEDLPAQWTGTFRDPRHMTAGNGAGRPENALTGTAYVANSVDLPVTVPAEQGRYRLWRNTSVATLAAGQSATLAPHTVGYESDEDLDNGFRPPGLIRLSTTTGPTPEYLRDFGREVSPGTTTHHLTLYRAASGALVFSAGSIQWAWGLDTYHDGEVEPADPRMQQATVNLFADMGVQPATLMAALVPAGPSTDTAPPTVTVTAPAAQTSSAANGSLVTLQGTAADTGGGRVAGVEVSVDGGRSWHPATGTTNWTYRLHTYGVGSHLVQVRAVDDSANVGQTPATRQFTLTGPSTLFGARVPAVPAAADGSAAELGVRFTPTIDGVVTGVRFYKGAGNTGTHTGSLWTAGGSRLATGTFVDETSTGWQTLSFGAPVNVSAGSSYVASYQAPNGHYAADARFFSPADHDATPLIARRSTGNEPNGVYAAGTGFPGNSWQDTNYYVDVRFVPSANAPPTVVATNPLDRATGVPVSGTLQAVFSKPVTASSIQFTVTDGGTPVAGTRSYNSATRTVTFTPAANLAAARLHTATVSATDTDGNSTEEPKVWSFTTELDPGVDKLFATDAVPEHPAALGDTTPIELGVRFTPARTGWIIGLRFYQGPGNTGTHTGTLWRADGTPLAQVTFPAGSGAGWQTVAFGTPVPVTGGQPYVVSYFAPNGSYAYDEYFFDTALTSGALTAPGTGNGVYRYGSSGFPQNSYHNTNYWVDPLFRPDPAAPVPSPTPPPGPTPTVTPSSNPSPVPTGPAQPPTGVTAFAPDATPAVAGWNDPDAVEVGTRFTVDTTGNVTGLRFYQGPGNSGPHVGTLWSAAGAALAAVTFGAGTGSGWQHATFPQPVPVSPGNQYVISYHAPAGHYAATVNAFLSAGVDRPPLHVPANGGVYRYGARGFPTNAANHNYWVDVYFEPPG